MAIAYDASTDGGDNGGSTTSLTYAHTCTGSDGLLTVAISGDTIGGADDISSVTYNSVGMTLITKITATIGRYAYLYRLFSPSTGANNIVITCSSSHYILSVCSSYAGVSGAGVDASTTNTAPALSASITTSLTTVADNCWVIMGGYGYSASLPQVAGTGATLRKSGTFGVTGIYDSNSAVTPAGSYSMTWSFATPPAGQAMGSILASFAPPGGGGTNWGPLLGLGNNRLVSVVS